jgi:hypothetical protein
MYLGFRPIRNKARTDDWDSLAWAHRYQQSIKTKWEVLELRDHQCAPDVFHEELMTKEFHYEDIVNMSYRSLFLESQAEISSARTWCGP